MNNTLHFEHEQYILTLIYFFTFVAIAVKLFSLTPHIIYMHMCCLKSIVSGKV